jgi:hypothetical protein
MLFSVFLTCTRSVKKFGWSPVFLTAIIVPVRAAEHRCLHSSIHHRKTFEITYNQKCQLCMIVACLTRQLMEVVEQAFVMHCMYIKGHVLE